MDITIYFVGGTREEALETFPFDSVESAEDYIRDQDSDLLWVYSATLAVEPSDLELA